MAHGSRRHVCARSGAGGAAQLENRPSGEGESKRGLEQLGAMPGLVRDLRGLAAHGARAESLGGAGGRTLPCS